jgi:cytidyltransferase-like protein
LAGYERSISYRLNNYISREEMSKKKKVFVTGCFDMLHSGHIEFFREAAKYGDVYVGLGSDKTVYNLKGRYPVNNQDERKFMINALSCVRECIINSGAGIMDFIKEIKAIKPDFFVVNEDGNTPLKEELSKTLGIKYIVLKRTPYKNLPVRSTTALREECNMPYRIDLAGGWLDQPYVGKYAAGPVLTISIEPTVEFNERSGMASSTRIKAIELWHTNVPSGNKEQLAKVLFSYENPPGTKIVAGSQDAIGIVMPALNKLNYDGGYWPASISSVHDEGILSWIENHLYLIMLGPRKKHFDVLANTDINKANAKCLSDAAERCWDAILAKDLNKFGEYFRKSFEAQIRMFPNMVDYGIFKIIDRYINSAYGWKLSGAGGGGYLIFVAEKPIKGAIQVKIRRNNL